MSVYHTHNTHVYMIERQLNMSFIFANSDFFLKSIVSEVFCVKQNFILSYETLFKKRSSDFVTVPPMSFCVSVLEIQ